MKRSRPSAEPEVDLAQALETLQVRCCGPRPDCNPRPRPVCVRRWRRQAVERSPSAAVAPAREDRAVYFPAPMRRRAGACGVCAVRWRPCAAAAPPSALSWQEPLGCVGASREQRAARCARDECDHWPSPRRLTASRRGPHAARVRWHVALPAACLRTCAASMQRQARAWRGVCRLQCWRHVRHTARTGWRSEPRECDARAQAADYLSRPHGPPGAVNFTVTSIVALSPWAPRRALELHFSSRLPSH